MPIISRSPEYLDQKGIRYSHSVHYREQTVARTADAERVPAQELAKTAVYKGYSGLGFVVVAADDFVDLAKIAALAGALLHPTAGRKRIRRTVSRLRTGRHASVWMCLRPSGDRGDRNQRAGICRLNSRVAPGHYPHELWRFCAVDETGGSLDCARRSMRLSPEFGGRNTEHGLN